jgi:hypothetical protein
MSYFMAEDISDPTSMLSEIYPSIKRLVFEIRDLQSGKKKSKVRRIEATYRPVWQPQ